MPAVGMDLLVLEDHGQVMLKGTFPGNHDSPEKSEGMDIFGRYEIADSPGSFGSAFPGNLPYPKVPDDEVHQEDNYTGPIQQQ